MQNYESLQETPIDVEDLEDHGIVFHDPDPIRSKWNHIEDLDSFFTRMYKYHQHHGFVCMLLQKVFKQLQFVFVCFLTVYLIHGINYPVLFHYGPQTPIPKPSLKDIILPLGQCVTNFNILTWFCLIIAALVLFVKCITIFYQMILFWDIKQFYNVALQIDDKNLDNMTWHEIQAKIKIVQLEQQMCIHKKDLTELDIYHRILRQENYIIAMVNKHLLPPRINIPFLGEVVYWTNGLRYNIQILLFWSPWSPFESPWHLREEYKRQNMRQECANQLGKHILWLSIINLVFAPLILVWQVLFTFFNYAETIRREPGQIGIRNWSLFGKLYLRHFNELDHELHARLTRAYRPATKYMAAFSNPIATTVAQFVEFICGAIFAVILILTIYDEDVLVVEHVITVMTFLGTMIAVCKSVIPDDTMVWCPDTLLQAVVMHTHYLPPNWRGHAHTSKIRRDFQQLFQYRFVTLLEELLSPIMTPYLLCRWILPRALEIVDFFRIFTVSVTGVGDVCSFAQMDVKKHGNPDWQPMTHHHPDQFAQAEDGKVELSLVHFTATNPAWIPPLEAQQFVVDLQSDVTPMCQDSDVMLFASFYNILDTSSNANMDLNMQSLMNLKKRPDIFASTTAFKTAVSGAEGRDFLAPASMTSSALALHDLNFRKKEDRRVSSARPEETTPLLVSKKSTF